MLILLDIDGVMVPANSWKKPEFHADGFPVFSSRSTSALQKIITETGASILLTTSHKTKYNMAEWQHIFELRGVKANRINSLTSNSLEINRKDEILNWYQSKHKPNERFVIIDDDKILNQLPSQLKDNLVLTSSSVGLTDELAEHAISILKNSAVNLV